MAVLKVLEATDLDAMACVAAEHEYAVPFAGERHGSGEGVGTGQLQLEDPTPWIPKDELPSSNSAVVTSRELGSRSLNSCGSDASPVTMSM